MSIGNFFTEKKFYVAALLYFAISALLISKYGIQLTGEAEKFLENANLLLHGQHFFNGLFGYLYLAYILVVALFVKLGVNLVAVAVLQVILSFTAAICLYKLLARTLGNPNIAFLFFLVYLICFPIQRWNFYLYSESMHTSLLVIGIYLFDKVLANKGKRAILPMLIVSFLILLSRPVGIIFISTGYVVVLFWLYSNKYKKAFYLSSAFALIAFVALINSPYTSFINPDSIRRMEVICQVPETNQSAAYVEYNRAGLYQAFMVIRDEVGFGKFIQTGIKKLAYFFGMYRGYYSWKTNLALLSFTLLYPLMLIGIFFTTDKKFQYARLFALLYISLTAMGIFFTCDEWSNRFICPVFPFVLILAAGGVSAIAEKIRNGKTVI